MCLVTEMFDKDGNGTIDVYEFGDPFNYINEWRNTFNRIDKDNSGFIEFEELKRGKS